MRKKRWTEKQLRVKIQEVKSDINYRKKTIQRAEDDLRDLAVLLAFYQKKLQAKFENPSSKRFGEKA